MFFFNILVNKNLISWLEGSSLHLHPSSQCISNTPPLSASASSQSTHLNASYQRIPPPLRSPSLPAGPWLRPPPPSPPPHPPPPPPPLQPSLQHRHQWPKHPNTLSSNSWTFFSSCPPPSNHLSGTKIKVAAQIHHILIKLPSDAITPRNKTIKDIHCSSWTKSYSFCLKSRNRNVNGLQSSFKSQDHVFYTKNSYRAICLSFSDSYKMLQNVNEKQMSMENIGDSYKV